MDNAKGTTDVSFFFLFALKGRDDWVMRQNREGELDKVYHEKPLQG